MKLSSIFLVLYFWGGVAFAGGIDGHVTGMDGKPVSGVAVALGDGKHEALFLKTDAAGQFHGENIPVGVYGITVSASSGAAFLWDIAVPEVGVVGGVSLNIDRQSVRIVGHIHSTGKTQFPQNLKVAGAQLENKVGSNFYGEIQGNEYHISLPPGTYVVVAKNHEWLGHSEIFHVPGSAAEYDFFVNLMLGSNPSLAEKILAMEKADQKTRIDAIAHPEDPKFQDIEHNIDSENLMGTSKNEFSPLLNSANRVFP